jgi:hypothetical protein
VTFIAALELDETGDRAGQAAGFTLAQHGEHVIGADLRFELAAARPAFGRGDVAGHRQLCWLGGETVIWSATAHMRADDRAGLGGGAFVEPLNVRGER